MQATPVAQAALAICALKGAKKVKSSMFNPYGQALYEQMCKELISPAAARTFLKLAKEAKIPTWVTGYLDIEQIQSAAK
ncbi:MAG: hypothetical protein KME06_09425 [Kastovskya adunca ATA6-11-RM4]|jgi:hypothetical protein|nr:hypothetical protein [Kastovskya adunca ATA6-11-RM4]